MFNSFQNYDYGSQDQFLSTISKWFIFALSLVLFIVTINSPHPNWDILGYSASAISLENSNPEYIHTYVYQQFKEFASPEMFNEFTAEVPHPYTMYTDSEAFYQQIPYYKIRLIFVILILALTKMGVNICFAGHLITAFFASAGLIAFYFAYRKLIYPIFWFTIPFFIIGFNIHQVAQLVSVDSLAFFWVGLICYTFINNKWIPFFLLLASSVLIRTDLICLVALFAGYLIFFKPDLRLATAITVLASAILYLFVNNFAGNYGWSTLFYFVFVTDMQATLPSEYSGFNISLKQYLSAITSNIGIFYYDQAVIIFEIILAIQFSITISQMKTISSSKKIGMNDIYRNPTYVLTIISIFYLIIHYFLFPILFYRFFSGQYMVAALGLLATISNLIKQKN